MGNLVIAALFAVVTV